MGSKLLSLVIVFLGLPSFMLSDSSNKDVTSYDTLAKLKVDNLNTLDNINKHVKYGDSTKTRDR